MRATPAVMEGFQSWRASLVMLERNSLVGRNLSNFFLDQMS